MDKGEKEILLFQIQRIFSSLSKNTLYLLEGIKKEHQFNFDKLKDSLPPEYFNIISQAEFIDEPRFSYFRKIILDRVGDAKRELLGELDKYKIEFDRDEDL